MLACQPGGHELDFTADRIENTKNWSQLPGWFSIDWVSGKHFRESKCGHAVWTTSPTSFDWFIKLWVLAPCPITQRHGKDPVPICFWFLMKLVQNVRLWNNSQAWHPNKSLNASPEVALNNGSHSKWCRTVSYRPHLLFLSNRFCFLLKMYLFTNSLND